MLSNYRVDGNATSSAAVDQATHSGAWGFGLVSTLTHGAARHRVMRQPLT